MLQRVDPPAERVSVVIFDHWFRRVFMDPKPEVANVSGSETEEGGRISAQLTLRLIRPVLEARRPVFEAGKE